MLHQGKVINPTFHIDAFGCPSSQYEGEAVRSLLLKNGFQEAIHSTPDVYLINTCVVTEAAVRKVRKAARQAKRLYPTTTIVLVGCYPQVFSREISTYHPETDIILGNEGRSKLPALIKERLEKKHTNMKNLLPWNMVNSKAPCAPLHLLTEDMDYTRLRPVLKIQEGCHQDCSYCIVTQARGKPRSLSVKATLTLAENFLEKGYREIILAGTNLGLYGYDLQNIQGHPPLIELLKLLDKLPYRYRIRLSYLEPGSITEELLHAMGQLEKVCPYLYLPLQSASDKILHKMDRGYNTQKLDHLIEAARKYMPPVNIQADLIVGFPGETEDDHVLTMQQVQQWELSGLHIFSFSPRPQTKAASWKKEEVPPETQKIRYREMQELNRKLSWQYHLKMCDKNLRVLVEKNKHGQAEGFSDHNIWVNFPNHDNIRGCFVDVKPLYCTPKGIEGKMLNSTKFLV